MQFGLKQLKSFVFMLCATAQVSVLASSRLYRPLEITAKRGATTLQRGVRAPMVPASHSSYSAIARPGVSSIPASSFVMPGTTVGQSGRIGQIRAFSALKNGPVEYNVYLTGENVDPIEMRGMGDPTVQYASLKEALEAIEGVPFYEGLPEKSVSQKDHIKVIYQGRVNQEAPHGYSWRYESDDAYNRRRFLQARNVIEGDGTVSMPFSNALMKKYEFSDRDQLRKALESFNPDQTNRNEITKKQELLAELDKVGNKSALSVMTSDLYGVRKNLKQIAQSTLKQMADKALSKKRTRQWVESRISWNKGWFARITGKNYLDFRDLDLSGVDLSRLDLSGANFSKALLVNTNFSGSNLSDAEFYSADLTDVNFKDANLTKAILRGYLLRANFSGANLTGAELNNAEATGAKFIKADLTDAKLSGTHLTGADLTDAIVTNAVFDGAHLFGANLTGANLESAYLYGADLTDAIGITLNKTYMSRINPL